MRPHTINEWKTGSFLFRHYSRFFPSFVFFAKNVTKIKTIKSHFAWEMTKDQKKRVQQNTTISCNNHIIWLINLRRFNDANNWLILIFLQESLFSQFHNKNKTKITYFSSRNASVYVKISLLDTKKSSLLNVIVRISFINAKLLEI